MFVQIAFQRHHRSSSLAILETLFIFHSFQVFSGIDVPYISAIVDLDGGGTMRKFDRL